jgi:hypothetical protein
MSRIMRIYYYGVLGAIGGLIGWQVSNVLGLSFTANIYLSEIVVGALIGLCIGFSIGLAEGVLRQDLVHTLKSSLVSGLLGMLGGAIGLPLAEGLFQLLGAQTWGRLLGWGLFGLLTGLAAGVTGGAQMWKGGLGGLLGGLLGGVLLLLTRLVVPDPYLGKGAGLLLLGGAVGSFIALIVFILSRAWFEVTAGKMKGMEFILDKFLSSTGPSAFIGSDPLKSDIILPDPEIAPQHAMLKGAGNYFNLKDMSMNGTFINNKRVELARLQDHQKIRLGKTELVYHEKR